MASNCVEFLITILILNPIATIRSDDINQKTSSRCDLLCSDDNLNLLEKFKTDCQRGCRYFNLEFITSAGNLDKVTDLNSTENQCKISCNEAYEELDKRDSCHIGCNQMYEIQSKAPYVHGWLVYMGASDRSMVLMQPDLDLLSEDDWILLDAVYHPHEYDSFGDSYKLTETRIQTMPIYPMQKISTLEFCIPIWMVMFPLLIVIVLIVHHYRNVLRDLIYQGSGVSRINTDFDKQTKKLDNFIVSLESYFYPSPAVRLPKYSDIEEEILSSSDDDGITNYISEKTDEHRNVVA